MEKPLYLELFLHLNARQLHLPLGYTCAALYLES